MLNINCFYAEGFRGSLRIWFHSDSALKPFVCSVQCSWIYFYFELYWPYLLSVALLLIHMVSKYQFFKLWNIYQNINFFNTMKHNQKLWFAWNFNWNFAWNIMWYPRLNLLGMCSLQYTAPITWTYLTFFIFLMFISFFFHFFCLYQKSIQKM